MNYNQVAADSTGQLLYSEKINSVYSAKIGYSF